MRNAHDRFQARVREVDIYFDFLRCTLAPNATVEYHDTQSPPSVHQVPLTHDIQRILKANAFLILYNLVESTIRQAILEIYDAVSSENLTYRQLRSELRHLWISHRHGSPTLDKTVLERVRQLVEEVANDTVVALDPDYLPIGGNIDAAKVRELADAYGFSKRVRPDVKGGEKLLSVKTNRNNLAHGHISFIECGSDIHPEDLRNLREQIVCYLEDVLQNVEHYIRGRHYCATA